jgi:hypothetical protein
VKFHFKFAVGKEALGVLLFSPGNIIPTILHTNLHLHAAVTKRATGEAFGPPKSSALCEIVDLWKEKYFYVF